MAIFKRRSSRSWLRHLKEAVWPGMGWVRTARYYRHRIFRTGDSVYKITAGLATGVAVSWTPYLGTHLLQSAFFTWLLKGNVIAALAGTLWGNPSTFPLLFWMSYKTGVIACTVFGLSNFVNFPDDTDMTGFMDRPWSFLPFIFDHPLKLLLPLTVGGYLCALLAWPLAYGVLYYPVRVVHRAYSRQRAQRLQKKKGSKDRRNRNRSS